METIASKAEEKENSYRVHIYKRSNETTRQFEFRKHLYDKIFNDIKDEEKALIYSNIWVNILSLGCAYPDEVMEKVKKYKPADEVNIYKSKAIE